ncbi:Inner membrane protein yqcE [Escherichia coli]|uniref:Inner membrane protein yqcE n=1 Tax=Escherichia coli TaxID=562 RepID=A0A485JAR3_ECOLX|nr:Inner membrane protein yqcE [Escherichia coli]
MSFVYPIIGYWQDTLPAAEAYRNMWLMGMAAACHGDRLYLLLLFPKNSYC